jgi:hypothetical protein
MHFNLNFFNIYLQEVTTVLLLSYNSNNVAKVTGQLKGDMFPVWGK